MEYQHLLNIFMHILNKHAPIKKRISEQTKVTLRQEKSAKPSLKGVNYGIDS